LLCPTREPLTCEEMIFTETPLPGAYLLDVEAREDERGFFARTFCAREFCERGLKPEFVQCSVSYNTRKGTLRGMHWQAAPHGEGKLVRCTRGAIFDVIIDLRPDSPAFKRWFSVELTDTNRRQLYIPEGCAHGFQTLADGTEVFYQMTEFHVPESARGLRWNDPTFNIAWPDTPHRIMHPRDAAYPDYV
jgi:dTDP-4-dehydrorhamnose 3,5-epimerase